MVDFACKGCPLVDKKDENASYGCLDGSAFKRSFDAVIKRDYKTFMHYNYNLLRRLRRALKKEKED